MKIKYGDELEVKRVGDEVWIGVTGNMRNEEGLLLVRHIHLTPSQARQLGEQIVRLGRRATAMTDRG